MTNRLLPVHSTEDILAQYQQTPIASLLEYHNLNRPFETYESAKLLVGMCMDNRKHLKMPDNFSFIIRSGGANLRYSEFKVSYAISVGQIRHIALIGHNHCGMAGLVSRRDEFISGLVTNAGWDQRRAEDHFLHFAPMFEIGDEIEFILNEAKRLRMVYPKICIAPMFYLVEDNKLYFIDEAEK
jgi:carbonic anhydrase